MRVRLAELRKALDHLRYNIDSGDDAWVEVQLRAEDIAAGRLCDHIEVSATWEKQPSSYSSYLTMVTHVTTVEIFPNTENRPVRFTEQAVQDLVEKKD